VQCYYSNCEGSAVKDQQIVIASDVLIVTLPGGGVMEPLPDANDSIESTQEINFLDVVVIPLLQARLEVDWWHILVA